MHEIVGRKALAILDALEKGATPASVSNELLERNDPDAKIYPCSDCGKMRSQNEGGTVFTVCDSCWDKRYSKIAF